MPAAKYDLLIRAGRVFCAETGLDGPGAVAIRGDRIAAAGAKVAGKARQTLDFPDGLALPGFVDLHAHPGPPDWNYGIDADQHILPRGTTTILSQGDAGAGVWPYFRDEIIKASRIRVRLAIAPTLVGESKSGRWYGDLDEVDVDTCVRTIEEGGDLIWGVAINAAGGVSADNAKEVMRRSIAAAERTGRPLLFGNRKEPSDWPLAEQLELLRPGDVFTYCFHPGYETIVSGGRVLDAVWKARERGVLFDIGHGMSSLDFKIAETAIAEGFLPDTISTDFYRRHLGAKPPHDMPRTISKLMAAGMPERDALKSATARPAGVLGLAGEIGTLAPGACADVAVLRWNPDAAPLVDVSGATRPGGCWEPVLIVRGGETVQ